MQDTSFLIVAERTNANGSRKFKRLLDEEDYDGLVGMARQEVRDGSHLLEFRESRDRREELSAGELRPLGVENGLLAVG